MGPDRSGVRVRLHRWLRGAASRMLRQRMVCRMLRQVLYVVCCMLHVHAAAGVVRCLLHVACDNPQTTFAHNDAVMCMELGGGRTEGGQSDSSNVTDNRVKGTDNRVKGTDNRVKGTDNRVKGTGPGLTGR